MYVKVKNSKVERFPFSIFDLRKENPSTLFSATLTADQLSAVGVFSVTEQPKPATDRFSYAVKRALPELVDGQWVVLWDVVLKSSGELAEDNQKQEESIRDSRNGKLADSDWTQVADAPVDKAAWATYRQALRDVTSQTGFPWEVTWPAKPE